MTMDITNNPLKVPRSALFSIVPIGVGTEMTESLESFTCRLAREHQVGRHAVEQMVNRLGNPLYFDLSGPPRLDAPTEMAAEFGRRLAKLTMRPEVGALGLGRLSGRISTMHTLRKYRAWCGDCFCDNRDASVPAHLPLVWSLSAYRVCSKHGMVLQMQCPCCGKQSDASNSWSRDIDHCPWCDHDLARRNTDQTPVFVSVPHLQDVNVDIFCSGVLGQFAAQIGQAHLRPNGCAVTAAVESAIARGLAINRKDFSAKAGLSNPTLHTVLSGRGHPSLSVLLRIAAAGDVSMAGMLYSALWTTDVRGLAPAELSRAPRLRAKRNHDWEQIRSYVNAALVAGQPLSMRQLSRDLELDQSFFSAKVGDVRDQIALRARQSREESRALRLEKFTELAKKACQSLTSRGTRISARAISKEMNLPVGSPIMRRALKLART